MPTAEIIAIGTELLLGETADSNTRFIARVLRGLGVDLFRAQIVGDNTARIAEAVREALARADIVITTGGLGPTVDDPTRQAVAEACGAPLEFHPELWEQIQARVALYGRIPTQNQKRQAYIPKDAIVLSNPVGTAPAFIVEFIEPQENDPQRTGAGGREVYLRDTNNSSRTSHLHAENSRPKSAQTENGVRSGVVISLPGVPREMETLLTDGVVPYLQRRFDLRELIRVRTLHVSGMGEAALDELVGDLETLANPTVGLTAHSGIVDVRIAAKAANETDAEKMIAAVEEDIRPRLGNNVFGADEETLEESTLQAVAGHGWTLACLESRLGGALLTRLARGGNPAYRGGCIRDIRSDALVAETEAVRRSEHASIALGVHLEQTDESQVISIIILMPAGRQERNLTYGGHPANASRWASNMALDLLRRAAQEAQSR
jgi:molybdenum cofactor synthesis domain-containing protein